MCDKTKELQTLPDSMSMTNDVKWIFSSSGRYMFVRFAVDSSIYSSTGFFAKIHNGNSKTNVILTYHKYHSLSRFCAFQLIVVVLVKMTLDSVPVSFVELMKDLVLMMINVKIIFFVDTKIVRPHLMKIITVVQKMNF